MHGASVQLCYVRLVVFSIFLLPLSLFFLFKISHGVVLHRASVGIGLSVSSVFILQPFLVWRRKESFQRVTCGGRAAEANEAFDASQLAWRFARYSLLPTLPPPRRKGLLKNAAKGGRASFQCSGMAVAGRCNHAWWDGLPSQALRSTDMRAAYCRGFERIAVQEQWWHVIAE